MKNFFDYINPIARLGDTNSSILFPLTTNVLFIICSEIVSQIIFKDPMIVGMYIIFINVALIIYFAFRDGIRGGIISAISAIGYYFYIIESRGYKDDQLISALETTAVLAILYCTLGFIIGWLKQRIDLLIEHEADEKKRLQSIIEQLPVGIIITDNTGKLVQRNKQLDHILGVKIPLGFTLGKDTLKNEKINGKPVEPKESPLFQALKTGKPVIGRELLFERKDKKLLSLQVSSAPILNSRKKVIAAASIINDVTLLKELERHKDDFLAIASHELKTPVTSIKAYAQVLKARFAKKGDMDTVEKLQKLDNQINRLTNLIKDLLDVTKIQAGKLQLSEEYFDLSELVQQVVEDIQLTSKKNKIEMQLAPSKILFADREKIGQVIINFLTNAIKYSPTRRPIVVSTENKKDEITVCVKDFGPGIPLGEQKQVFEQFFRASGHQRNTFPGLGLGLYISSEIIRRAGGKIWVKSAVGKGSTFCFSLPLKNRD